MPKTAVTFEGDNLADAMLSAKTEADAFFLAIDMAKHVAITAGAFKEEKGNGESKEDVVTGDDVPLDNETVLHCALDLLMTCYSSDNTIKGVSAPDAVGKLLLKYNVDSLNDVEPEKASELFKDAEEIASEYGVSN